jgi:hypothetical protein
LRVIAPTSRRPPTATPPSLADPPTPTGTRLRESTRVVAVCGPSKATSSLAQERVEPPNKVAPSVSSDGSTAIVGGLDDNGGADAAWVYVTTPTAPPLVMIGPLPPATIGLPYSQTLTASGGTPPYVWSLVSGPHQMALRCHLVRGCCRGRRPRPAALPSPSGFRTPQPPCH